MGLGQEEGEEVAEEEEEDMGVDVDDVHKWVSVCLSDSLSVCLSVCRYVLTLTLCSFHFVEVPALFVAYSYVTAAAKVGPLCLTFCYACE